MDSLVEDCGEELLSPPWGSLGRDAVLGAVASFSKLLLNVLNTTSTQHHERYTQLVLDRPPGVGLLTISNHTRCVLSAWQH
jgi:monolysocardiolipin acyltransferase